MFWNRKKKNKNEEEEKDELVEDISEAEDDEDFEEEEELEGEVLTEEDEEEEIPDVTVKVSSFDELLDFVSARKGATLQFMNKETGDVFELQEAHLRMAAVWGSITMHRESAPMEYARVMLAMELTENPEGFYVLPALTETELKKAVTEFCEERYNENGKKYASAPAKFIKLVEDNGDEAEWKAWVKSALYDKLTAFCEEKGIVLGENDG